MTDDVILTESLGEMWCNQKIKIRIFLLEVALHARPRLNIIVLLVTYLVNNIQ